MKVLISYDITSDEKRRKVAAILENILPRVQYSVFEGEAPDEVIPTTVKKALRHLEPETDSLSPSRVPSRPKTGRGTSAVRSPSRSR